METRTGNGQRVSLEKLMTDLKVVIDDGERLLKTGATQLRERAVAGARVTDETIRRNPYPSMGIIFGLGVLVGILGWNMIRNSAEEFQNELD